MSIRNHLEGKRFGRLVVIEQRGLNKNNTSLWFCKCDCGGDTIVPCNTLNYGTTRSCGCLAKEVTRNRSITHGRKKDPIYRIWNGMKQRCGNKKSVAYKNYGGRGITVCKEWRGEKGFENFLRDVGERPSPNHTIERLNNEDGYYKENVIWELRCNQVHNRRITLKATINGKTKPVSVWCKELGLCYQSVHRRVNTNKMSYEKAILTPFKKR